MSRREDDGPDDLADFLVGMFALGGFLFAVVCIIMLAVGAS